MLSYEETIEILASEKFSTTMSGGRDFSGVYSKCEIVSRIFYKSLEDVQTDVDVLVLQKHKNTKTCRIILNK